MGQLNSIHVMCGIIGSGKTTLSKRLAVEYDAVLYCYDVIPKKRWDDDMHHIMYGNIVRDLNNHKTVICDDLNIARSDRVAILNAISGINCKKILHVMLTSPALCFERVRIREKRSIPEGIIKHCLKQFESPALDEGWDEIIYHEYIEEVMPHDN